MRPCNQCNAVNMLCQTTSSKAKGAYRDPLRQGLLALGVGQSPHQGAVMPQIA